MKNKQEGLINKFIISRADGTILPEGVIFFVLRLDAHGDEEDTNAARESALLYANLTKNTRLVEDIKALSL